MQTLAAAVVAAVAWFALVLQLWILLAASDDWLRTVGNFFGYFTILTNLAVAVVLTGPIASRGRRWLADPRVRTAVAVYITTVGLVYVAILERLWNPQGAQLVADTALHKAVPLLYLAFWAAFVPAGAVRFTDVIAWLAYPLLFVAYTLARGAVTSWYPYPFLDVADLGYARVLLNTALLLCAFVVLSTLFVGIGRAKPAAKPGRIGP